jgi:hypothetical protein
MGAKLKMPENTGRKCSEPGEHCNSKGESPHIADRQCMHSSHWEGFVLGLVVKSDFTENEELLEDECG